MAETMDDEIEYGRRVAIMGYAVTPFFFINQFLARASLIVLYHRLFWSDGTFLRGIYLLTAIHVGWFITFFFMQLFFCNPVSLYWDILGEQEGTCIDGNAFLVAEETINSSLDFALLGIAVYVVQKVMTKNHIKTKLAFIFAVGGLSGVIGFIKIGIVYTVDNDAAQVNNANVFWDILQMSTSMLCICAPMYRTMLPMDTIWLRLKSSTEYLRSRTKLPYWTLGESRGSSSKVNKNNSNDSKSGARQRKVAGGAESNNSSETQRPFYIGGNETDYTWSQFDNSENIKLEVYQAKAKSSPNTSGKVTDADIV
ncbi:hypothetical protein QBC37DRAFT_434563 [Rhypophila decipiens]|uniref:Rhodopsin domain-containing protein n=1 Tax=Rhypophila decipiens TaxID=261697 RepID=A0AAN7AZ11_9PEZI|nr:hypothetical protein QBC37DRAFT_434563 [Rhypophila decipiens]